MARLLLAPNLIEIHEFCNNKEYYNLHEVIDKFVGNRKIDLLAVA